MVENIEGELFETVADPWLAVNNLPQPETRHLHRRASHAGNLGVHSRYEPEQYHETSHNTGTPTVTNNLLNVPTRQRNRGTSLPENISTSELYRLR